MRAARPPLRWTSAMAWSAMVVLPEDSGTYISTMRPLGRPPPRATSRVRAPVEMVSLFFFFLQVR